MGKILVKLFFKRVWGKTALPKGLLGTIQSISLAQIPLKPHGVPFPPQNHFFPGPIFNPKRSPAQPEPSRVQIWDPGSKNRSLGSKIAKLGTEKPCRIQWSAPQTEPYGAGYGRKPYVYPWGDFLLLFEAQLRAPMRPKPHFCPSQGIHFGDPN